MTNVLRRSSVLVLTVLLLAGLVVPAASAAPMVLATEEVTETPAVTEGTVVEYDGPGAFIPAPDAAEDDVELAWTYRYLIPTTMLLIALLVIALVVGYFLRVVRTRYTVVE